MLRPSWHLPSPWSVVGIAAAAFVALAGGCFRYQPPAITTGAAVVTEATEEAIRFDVDIELVNPNDEPLDLREFTYSARVNGTPVFQGKRVAGASLGAGATRHMSLPVVVPFDRVKWTPDALPTDAKWHVSGNLMYLTPGELAEILLDTKLHRPQAVFSGRGVVELVDAE